VTKDVVGAPPVMTGGTLGGIVDWMVGPVVGALVPVKNTGILACSAIAPAVFTVYATIYPVSAVLGCGKETVVCQGPTAPVAAWIVAMALPSSL